MHFHVLVPDGVFVTDENRLAFALHPVPTSTDVVAILDRIVRRIARRLADATRDDAVDEGVDVLAQGEGRGGGDLALAARRQADRTRRRAPARMVRRQSFSIFARRGRDRGARSGGARAVVP